MMGLTKPICACASCGIRDPALRYESVAVETLPACFKLDEAACQRRERLGHATLIVIGETEPVDLRPLMSCFECNDELYHLHSELVDGRRDGCRKVCHCNVSQQLTRVSLQCVQ